MNGANKKQETGTRLLMWFSQLLLLVFLVQWVKTTYKEERAGLQKQLALQYQLVESQLMDSAVFEVIARVSDEQPGPNVKVSISSQKHTSETMLSTRKDQFITINTHDTLPGTRRFQHFEKEVTYPAEPIIAPLPADADTTFPAMIARGVRILMSDSGMIKFSALSDSAKKAGFEKKLRSQGLPFSLSWQKPGKQKKPLIIFTPTTPGSDILVAGNYQTYLWKKLLPEMGFALLLLSITATAFWTMYRSLKKQQRLSIMKNDLVSNMTHELKTPIATVKVALEALDSFQVINDPKTSRDYIKMAVSEVDRLELLVSQALNTSLLEAGNITLQRDLVQADQLTEQTIQAQQLKFQQHDATVIFQKTGSDFAANADKLHLQGIIINLLDNSIKYAQDKPLITVSVEERENSILIQVSDNGPGIPAKYLDKVFDKFFRVPTGDVHNTKGYGLGLSYAKQAIENMSGSIAVNNNNDKGCTFTITLAKA